MHTKGSYPHNNIAVDIINFISTEIDRQEYSEAWHLRSGGFKDCDVYSIDDWWNNIFKKELIKKFNVDTRFINKTRK